MFMSLARWMCGIYAFFVSAMFVGQLRCVRGWCWGSWIDVFLGLVGVIGMCAWLVGAFAVGLAVKCRTAKDLEADMGGDPGQFLDEIQI